MFLRVIGFTIWSSKSLKKAWIMCENKRSNFARKDSFAHDWIDLVHDVLGVLVERVAVIVSLEFLVFSERQLEVDGTVHSPTATTQE